MQMHIIVRSSLGSAPSRYRPTASAIVSMTCWSTECLTHCDMTHCDIKEYMPKMQVFMQNVCKCRIF